jgi:CRP/FNR family cyclic AMP-dependent transcriptional regulator
MKERFEGEQNRRTVIETLKEQRIVTADAALAEEIANMAELIEVAAGGSIIEQDAEDNDVYLILTGSFDIIVNGQKVAKREPGNHVGEMAAIQPTQRRSATVKAAETSVVCKLTEPQLTDLGQKYPGVWRAIAKELARRLEERNKLVSHTREKIQVFIISSAEAIEIARTIQSAFQYDPFTINIWPEGVFLVSHYPIEKPRTPARSIGFCHSKSQHRMI